MWAMVRFGTFMWAMVRFGVFMWAMVRFGTLMREEELKMLYLENNH